VASFQLPVADILMAREMFDASPDGQAERARVEALISSLPDGRLEVSGYLVCDGVRCGDCHDCREGGA